MFKWICPSCGKTYKIAKRHRGRKVRCPQCNVITETDASLDVSSEHKDRSPASTAWYQEVGDTALGPFSLDELLQMIAAGTLDRSDRLKDGKHGRWRTASELPELVDFWANAEATQVARSTSVETNQVERGEYGAGPIDSRALEILRAACGGLGDVIFVLTWNGLLCKLAFLTMVVVCLAICFSYAFSGHLVAAFLLPLLPAFGWLIIDVLLLIRWRAKCDKCDETVYK